MPRWLRSMWPLLLTSCVVPAPNSSTGAANAHSPDHGTGVHDSAEIESDVASITFVVLRISVGPTGLAENVTVLSGPTDFAQEATRYASAQKYRPALDADGRPVRGTITVRVRFAPQMPLSRQGADGHEPAR
jgi:hypothetical protein